MRLHIIMQIFFGLFLGIVSRRGSFWGWMIWERKLGAQEIGALGKDILNLCYSERKLHRFAVQYITWKPIVYRFNIDIGKTFYGEESKYIKLNFASLFCIS